MSKLFRPERVCAVSMMSVLRDARVNGMEGCEGLLVERQGLPPACASHHAVQHIRRVPHEVCFKALPVATPKILIVMHTAVCLVVIQTETAYSHHMLQQGAKPWLQPSTACAAMMPDGQSPVLNPTAVTTQPAPSLQPLCCNLNCTPFTFQLRQQGETLARLVANLRDLSSTRELWHQDFEQITPSLLAFFIRDHTDLLLRLEFLVVTGESPTKHLKEIFKISNNLFLRIHHGYRMWLRMRTVRAQARARNEEVEEEQVKPSKKIHFHSYR